jgi:hypothetical protein
VQGFLLDKPVQRCHNRVIEVEKELIMEEEFVTVADMMAALSALPPDARLVVTQSGYYCYNELAGIMLPEAYTVEGEDEGIPAGTVVYRLGHSHQSY